MTGHLIHVGFPKTGSKLLQRWFEQHPQLAFSQWGIAGFHGVLDLVDAANEPPGKFRYRVTSAEGLSAPPPKSGSVYVNYDARTLPHAELQQRACSLLTELAPKARILIVTRGFRAMILSSYSQYVRSGGSSDLETLLAHGETNTPWHYDFVIGLFRKAFGADEVLVLPYELLRDDRAAFAAELQGWLGLEDHPLPETRLNPSLSPVELRWYPRLTRLISRLPLGESVQSRLLRRFIAGAAVNRWRRVIGMLQRVKPATPVTAELISDEALEPFRGQAASLRRNPLFANYASEYLFDI